jgi:cell division ATPase FtsA
VQNPAGLYASRLSCEAYVITANVGHIQNVLKCVNNSGYDVREVVFTGLADGSSLLGRSNPESADILVDMGSSLTEICGYADGSLTGFDIVPAGGEDYKSGFTNNGQFDYIIVKTKSMLEDLSKSTRAINPVILAGGASLSDGMVEYLEERLSHPVKMGIVKDVRGNISSMDSIRLSTAIGLAKYAQGKYLERARSRANLPSNLVAKVIDIFNNYF